MRKLLPEFELLDTQFWQLRANKDVDQDFLRKIRDHILLCEHIAGSEEERSIITRTTYWWRKRASLFGMDLNPKLLSGSTKTREEIEANDRIFLRSLHIAADGPPEDGKDGAL
ncbi:MAG: hypothetical protein HYT67_01925 [Candidatus Yanofskybacteria bacterium]|nr:hypothetical protein [Candidatus Yanofskybacteria bacterium]